MLAGIIGDLHDVQLEARVAPSDGVDAGDVWALVTHGLHKLWSLKRHVRARIQRVKTELDGNL